MPQSGDRATQEGLRAGSSEREWYNINVFAWKRDAEGISKPHCPLSRPE